MRVPFVMAYAKGLGSQIINAINNLEYVADEGLPRIRYEKNGNVITLLIWRLKSSVTLPWTSAGTDGKWTIILCTPLPLDWRLGPRAFRKLRRFVIGEGNQNGEGEYYLAGPWSIQKVAELYPGFAERYLKVGVFTEEGEWIGPIPDAELIAPHVILGDFSPEKTATLDYNPTDQACTDDEEPVEEDIFFGESPLS